MKIITKILFLITIVIGLSLTAHAEHGNRGMGLWQDLSVAESFSNPLNHAAFFENQEVFPEFKKTMIYGVSTKNPVAWSDYTSHTREMAHIALKSWISAMNTINAATKGALAKELGLNIVLFDSASAIMVLRSGLISVGTMPTGMDITFDTYDQNIHDIGHITRPAHWLPKIKAWEECLKINLSEYEPIPTKSTFCANTLHTNDILKFIIKKKSAPTEPKPEQKLPQPASTNCIPLTPDGPRPAATVCKTDTPLDMPQPAATTAKGTATSALPQPAATTAKATVSAVPSNVIMDNESAY